MGNKLDVQYAFHRDHNSLSFFRGLSFLSLRYISGSGVHIQLKACHTRIHVRNLMWRYRKKVCIHLKTFIYFGPYFKGKPKTYFYCGVITEMEGFKLTIQTRSNFLLTRILDELYDSLNLLQVRDTDGRPLFHIMIGYFHADWRRHCV